MISLTSGAAEPRPTCIGCGGCSAGPAMPITFIPSLLIPVAGLVSGTLLLSQVSGDGGQLAGALTGLVAGVLVARFRVIRQLPPTVSQEIRGQADTGTYRRKDRDLG